MAPTFLFIVLAALVHFSSAASNFPSFRQVRRIDIRKHKNGRQTPAPFNCVKAGFFADPRDCYRFYRCVDFYGNEQRFTLFEFVCAEGTIFDESLSVCNHPHAVHPPPACLATTLIITPTVAPAPVPPAPPAPVPTALPPVVTAAVETTTAPANPGTEATTASNPPTQPTAGPVTDPAVVTDSPTPTTAPTAAPTDAPTAAPTDPTAPTTAPTVPPTDAPTAAPTAPTAAPTDAPTAAPTAPTVPTTGSSAEITFAPDVFPVDPATTTTTAAPVPEPITTAAPVPEPITTAAPVPEPITTAAPAQVTTVAASTTIVSSGGSEVVPATPIVPPPTVAAPFMLTCNDDKFHRHPVRCDLYYKCVWTDLVFSVDLRACPAGQNYDEASGTCKSPARTTACVFATLPPATGVVTTVPTTTTVATEAPPAVPPAAVTTEAPAAVPTTTAATEAPATAAPPTTAQPAVETTATTAPSVPSQYTLAPGSLYDCKRPGHYPYQLDCIRFYRCFEIQPSVLKGLLYRCPLDYAYSTVTERCVRQNTLPACDRNGIRLPMDFPVPLIPLEDTTMVLLEDFDSFFGNPNYFYIPRRKIKNTPAQTGRIKNNPQSKIRY